MTVTLATLAAAVASVVVLVIGVLAIPVRLDVRAERLETTSLRWQIGWLFGLVVIQWPQPPPSSQAGATVEAEAVVAAAAATRRTRTRAERRRRTRFDALAFVRSPGLVRRVQRLVGDLLRHVTVERLSVDAAFGFEDPADTGFVYGCLSPVLVLADTYRLPVRCQPLFLECGVRGRGECALSVRPLVLMTTMLAFFLSPPVLRAVVRAVRTA